MLNIIYFQPKGIKPEYCEAGTLMESDTEYIYYLNEPCKILKSAVKIIDKNNVFCDKHGICKIKQQDNESNATF
jgi:hypothetical protein